MAPFKMYMNGCITVQQIYMKFGVAQNPIVAASCYFCGTEAPLVFGLHIVLCHQIFGQNLKILTFGQKDII